MQRKQKIRMIVGLAIGTLLAHVLRVFADGKPWSWANVVSSMMGIIMGSLILWRFWTPPPTTARAPRRIQVLVMGLMLLALAAVILVPIVEQAAMFFYAFAGLALLGAAIIGFLSLEPVSRKANTPLFLVGIGLLVLIFLCGLYGMLR